MPKHNSVWMKTIVFSIIAFIILVQSLSAKCDRFVGWVKPAKDAYQRNHRIYPVPDHLKELAVRFMPRLWVHPQSWQPIDFDDYLATARLIRMHDTKVLMTHPSAEQLSRLTNAQQCDVYLEAEQSKRYWLQQFAATSFIWTTVTVRPCGIGWCRSLRMWAT